MNVELRDLRKTFGAVCANAGISLRVERGTICGILGENGAGKSTLMKILSGFLRPDSGDVLLDGQTAAMASPDDALRLGIGMLHQDALDFPAMSVIDNFLAGSHGSLLLPRAPTRAALARMQAETGFAFDLDAKVEALTVGERQQLEILRLLWRGANVLILDEPTTGISSRQKEKLFAALAKLAARGKTILLVSHKLDDVQALCDRVFVLRHGTLVSEAAAPFDAGRLVRMMFGKDAAPETKRVSAAAPETRLSLKSVCVEHGRLRVPDVTLDVRRGEVIGLAGMSGSGQELLLRACAGLVRPSSGSILLDGDPIAGMSYLAIRRSGVAFVPAARMEEGLVSGMTVTEHCMLSDPGQGMFADWARGAERARERIGAFAIQAAPESRVEHLSGGNRQRLLLSLVPADARLILVEHPTRGLDMESASQLWKWLDGLARRGASILFTSSDLAEIQDHSDRVLVFFSGRATGPLRGATTGELGHLIGGELMEAGARK